ncbi:MAG: aspartate-semialdehyde dehydrogenase [Anaerolineales bacterium]
MTLPIPVAILGATGAVGQRFIQLLQAHPWFKVSELVASERSSGRAYAEVARWVLSDTIPPEIGATTVKALDAPLDSPIVFSALPSEVAQEVEARLARAGHMVFSNASAYRMAPDVPILMPEVNAEHLALLACQRSARNWTGGIVTNSNCTASPLVMALAPLRAFQPEALSLVSMQAVSGAGYPGVPSLDIMDNVIPYIAKEEEKLNEEPAKILGTLTDETIIPFPMVVDAACNRVPVLDCHLINVVVRFQQHPTLDDLLASWHSFQGPGNVPHLPSAPAQPVIVANQPDRPQPRRDRYAGEGMSTVVGRLREAPAFGGVQFLALAHNTIRGAAGCSILNAELAVQEGYVPNISL